MTKVLGLDSNSAVTVFSSVTVPHESRGEISEADLENYLSKAVWKSFDFLRSEAAERLEVSDVDLILSSARVVGMKVDGHEVLNPYGFVGRGLEISLCVTMVKRGILEAYEEKDGTTAEVFEKGSAVAYLLSKSLDIDYLMYAESENSLTRVFLATPIRTSYLGEFNWGRADIAKVYAENFGVPEETGFEIYNKFVLGDASLAVLEKSRRLFYSSFKKFVDGLTLQVRNISELGLKKAPPIYIQAVFSLPEELGKKTFVLGRRRAKIKRLEGKIEVSDLVNNPPYNVYEWLNQLAKRRIKWLMP
ncbi:MAG: hypothetical protein DDT40_01872 [candidate division WS2 bacterium]|nr:hypothetical protein [Candidatus Psychracetigena formicireducens]